MCENIFICYKFSQIPENSGQIQPQVVFCCKYNIVMRIQTKIQLILESNLVFQRFYQYHPNVLQNRSAARGCLGRDVSSFNPMVYQVVNHNNIQPMVERCDRIQRKMICAQIFLYVINSHKHQKIADKFNHRLYFVVNIT